MSGAKGEELLIPGTLAQVRKRIGVGMRYCGESVAHIMLRSWPKKVFNSTSSSGGTRRIPFRLCRQTTTTARPSGSRSDSRNVLPFSDKHSHSACVARTHTADKKNELHVIIFTPRASFSSAEYRLDAPSDFAPKHRRHHGV